MALGDAWWQDGEPTAEESAPLSLDYARAKAREFQVLLNALDTGYKAAWNALEIGALDATSTAEIVESIDAYDAKRAWIRGAAEAVNAAAAAVNAAGGRFPSLSVPGTLQALPALAVPALYAGGFALAAGAVIWGRDWLRGLNDRMARAQLLESVPPEKRAQLAQEIARSDVAVREAESSTLSVVAPAVKWIAIGALAFFAYRAWQSTRG